MFVTEIFIILNKALTNITKLCHGFSFELQKLKSAEKNHLCNTNFNHVMANGTHTKFLKHMPLRNKNCGNISQMGIIQQNIKH